MAKILILAEAVNGKTKRSSLELATWARKSGQPFVAMALGSAAKTIISDMGAQGVPEVLACEDGLYDKYNPELFANALAEAIQKSGATIVLSSASSTGRDLLPRVAARLNSGVLSDCVDLKLEGDALTAKKPMLAGKCFAKMSFEASPVQFVLMRANQLPTEPGPATTPKVTTLTPSQPLWAVVKEVAKGTSEKLDLTEANVIVSGGRGLKEAGNFKLLNDLAEVLGATVGASRAVVDAGWVSHGMQVGQTGKTVAPSLYIAVGISGAVQHLAGMSASKVIVAINSDPNAPIFQKATYGIVGDLFDVLPKLTEEFKKVMHR